MPIINQKKICNKQGHGLYNAVENKSCPKCKQESNKDYDVNIRAKDRKKIYNSNEWLDIREVALLRDNLLCQECLRKGIYTEAKIVHHIVELKDDVTKAYDLDNLESVCVACHNKEHKGK